VAHAQEELPSQEEAPSSQEGCRQEEASLEAVGREVALVEGWLVLWECRQEEERQQDWDQ
jgi:hypothetical protein